MEKIRVTYRRIRVWVEAQKPGKCQACGRKGRVELHHWHYYYSTAEVRKNHQLALVATSWLCFTCHRIADALRKVIDAPIYLALRLNKLRGEYALNQDPILQITERPLGPAS